MNRSSCVRTIGRCLSGLVPVVVATLFAGCITLPPQADEGMKAAKEGDLVGAEANLTAALKEMPEGHPLRGVILVALAKTQADEGKVGQAQLNAYAGIAAMQRFEPLKEFVADSYFVLGKIQEAQANYKAAEKSYMSSVQLHRGEQGTAKEEEPDHRAEALRAIASIQWGNRDFAAAESTLRQALRVAHDAHSVHSMVLAMGDMATLLAARGKYAEADETYLKFQTVLERAGPDAAQGLFSTYTDRAVLLEKSARRTEAGDLYRRALELQERQSPRQTSLIVAVMAAMSRNELAQQRPAEAEALARRALARAEQDLGAASPNVAVALDALATALEAQAQQQAAAPVRARALVILEKSLSPDDPELAAGLRASAGLARSLGDAAQADALEARAREVVARFEASRPKEWPVSDARGPCRLWAYPDSPTGDEFIVRGSGFKANEPVQVRSTSAGESIIAGTTTSRFGFLEPALLKPVVLGRDYGRAQFTVSGKSCEVSVVVPWRRAPTEFARTQ